ncbi:glutathionylspermidine synthase family protein [Haliscomenobacter hydrossis]|uniref:Glutathionylspermidine synthase n=1 Tax=Haliscomenobacter hydrossis (strain ATCC 27775 / DSM 1100 / LMG 10767 / O) TaxID=760192 RepID=F4KX02_HALH1|nr:glutathionylspermidine synthase family protein [Haliscomenobacter hydrossis]AEE53602.1 glutathionylspermidine synthase [Haliscomenobacter hydrossis DSM 1100]
MLKYKLPQLPNALFEELGWDYFVSPEGNEYLADEVVEISEAEREAFYEAGNRLYARFVETAEYILENNLLSTLGIPPNLYELIQYTWADERHLHLYGRFDLAGGTDGLPIKMLEFNADTPTSVPETAIIQWGQLRANGIPEDRQFNFLYEALVDNFKRLRELNPGREAAILFSTLKGAPEDNHNTEMLQVAAREAGFETAFCYVDEVIFSEVNGIFAADEQGNTTQYPYWFKLIPWEYIALDEPELLRLLTKIVTRGLAIVLNPAYTMLFQSKAILAHMWELQPYDPLLLKCSLKEPIGRENYPFVEKVVLGREGANVTIFDENGIADIARSGEYADQIKVYQSLAQLARDADGQYYQAGVFFAYEACGLGFRRSPHRIIDNGAQFVGHWVKV